MKMNYLIFVTVFALLSVGCSDEKEAPKDLNKQREVRGAILEQNVEKKGIPPLPTERGVIKTWPILEKSHNVCKDKGNYNDCFCKKSAFSGSVIIDGVRYTCR